MAPDAASIEDVMERCVAAGLAVRRADRTVGALRGADAEHRALSDGARAELVRLEAEVERLSQAFVAAQGPLREAGPALFHQRLAEVNRRIVERLARAT